ncbi:MAG: hypothetical protein COV70_04165 [Parcubacteria group bacterium CG11_big_fil_rev_8_21_14_0_20_39_22]|nr:MAG: hypothetical protein COV70_04165 [Parcubacteria group bacterium CG11_big_fil_rev_8_21_14_0_20_39_22]
MIFVLGGNDLEMEVTKQLLAMAGRRFVQPKKKWGDHSYTPGDLGLQPKDTSMSWIGTGRRKYKTLLDPATGSEFEGAFFVECRPSGWEGFEYQSPSSGIASYNTEWSIDHHGEEAHRPPSVLQVLSILEEDGFNISNSTRRWVELVAANDSGYIPAMLRIGATPEEVSRVRAADRAAQGITVSQEAEAERAIASAEKLDSGLLVVRLAHSKCATITDRLFGTWPDGRENLLVLSGDGESNYFGDGAICASLKEKFQGSWGGGSGFAKAGESAFWGGYAPQDEVLKLIR